MTPEIWTEQAVKKVVVPTLARYQARHLDSARADIARQMGVAVTRHSLRNALKKFGLRTPASYCRREAVDTDVQPPATEDEEITRLMRAVKGGPVKLEDLCDELDMPPGKVKRLIEVARADGKLIEVAHDSVGFKRPEPNPLVQDSGVAPVVGKPLVVGVASDLHFGSKWCMRKELAEFVDYAYAKGVRHMLCPGDFLDGLMKFLIYEQTARGFGEQVEDAIENLPRKPGLTWEFIDGNHDDSATEALGMESGRLVVDRFAEAGRRDIRYWGAGQAFVRLGGVVFELWHPAVKKAPYALSYVTQNHIRDMPVGQKPDVLLIGHLHCFDYLEQRGVHAMLVPAFQSPGSRFGRRLGGSPSCGGLVLTIERTAHGTIRRFSVDRSAYYYAERPREVEPGPQEIDAEAPRSRRKRAA